MPAPALRALPGGSLLMVNDKATHFFAYVALGALPVVAVELRVAGIALAGLMIPLGAAMEQLQRFVPGRSADRADLFADALGVFIGIAVALAFRAARRSFAPAAVRSSHEP